VNGTSAEVSQAEGYGRVSCYIPEIFSVEPNELLGILNDKTRVCFEESGCCIQQRHANQTGSQTEETTGPEFWSSEIHCDGHLPGLQAIEFIPAN
jgi:hypothetical protein